MKYRLQGSVTVEMSLLFPVILLVFTACVYAAFYFHDKNILAGAAYETAVVGSTKMRERDGVTEEDLVSLCQERIGSKCVLFAGTTVSVDISGEEISVSATAGRKGFKASVCKKAAVTEPEKKIRNAGKLEKGAEMVSDVIQGFMGGGNDTNGNEENTNGESDYD